MWFLWLFLALVVFFTIIEYPIILLILFVFVVLFVVIAIITNPHPTDIHAQNSSKKINNSTFSSPDVSWYKCGHCNTLLANGTSWCRICKILLPKDDILKAGLTDKSKSKKLSTSNTQKNSGVVYMLKSGSHYKIGRTNNLNRRVSELKIQLPQAVEVVHKIQSDDITGLERQWHQRFNHKRLNGEWFELSEKDIEEFKRNTKM